MAPAGQGARPCGNVADPPEVWVRVGPPVDLDLVDPDDDNTVEIMDAIVDLLPPEARLDREPTAAELAAATPSGTRRRGQGGLSTSRLAAPAPD